MSSMEWLRDKKPDHLKRGQEVCDERDAVQEIAAWGEVDQYPGAWHRFDSGSGRKED